MTTLIALLALVLAFSALAAQAKRKVAAQFGNLLAQELQLALTLMGHTQTAQGWSKPAHKGLLTVEVKTNAKTGKVRVAVTDAVSGKGCSLVLTGNVLRLSDHSEMQAQARKFVLDASSEYLKPVLDMASLGQAAQTSLKSAGKRVLGVLDRAERKLFPSKYSK